MTRTILPLDKYVSRMPDPRNAKGKRHPLKSILALVVIGLMCGHKLSESQIIADYTD